MLIALVVFLGTFPSYAKITDVTHQTLTHVVTIARAISVVQPNLDDTKLMEYGLGIYRASHRYGISPSILIAITQQETAFREDLPEGAAGEIGICQIRKAWLKHPQFRKEFGNAKLSDLKRPAKNFMFAAWILRDLKQKIGNSRTLPYWSYYNSVRFENRFKYFLLVNRNIAALRKASKMKLAEDDSESSASRREKPRAPASTPATAPAASAPTARGHWVSDALKKLDSAHLRQNERALND